MEVKQKINCKKFLQSQIESIFNKIEFVYPGGYMDENRAHGQLQAIKSIAKAMKDFVDAIEEEPVQKEKEKPNA